jgi:hypothetical protein
VTDVLTEWEYWQLHGSHEAVGLSSPSAGQPLVHVVPGTVEQALLAVSFTFTAAAAVANRVPFIEFFDQSGTAFASIATPFLLVATNVARVTFAVDCNQFGANSAARIGAPIPELRLGDGLAWQVGATAMAGADTITAARAFVRQWRVRE